MNTDESLTLRKVVQQCSNISLLENIKSDRTELEVERQRINNIVSLKDGSTTGDAELTDIRVSYYGKTRSAERRVM